METKEHKRTEDGGVGYGEAEGLTFLSSYPLSLSMVNEGYLSFNYSTSAVGARKKEVSKAILSSGKLISVVRENDFTFISISASWSIFVNNTSPPEGE